MRLALAIAILPRSASASGGSDRLEQAIRDYVETTDEYRRDRRDSVRIRMASETSKVGLRHRLVVLEREHQA